MNRSDLPFGNEFLPSQVDLLCLLDMVVSCKNDWHALEALIFERYFKNYKTSLYNRKKLANNTNEVIVSKDNVQELKGEIGMLQDIINGKLDKSIFTADNIDNKFALIMFNHIDAAKLNEAKRIVLNKLENGLTSG